MSLTALKLKVPISTPRRIRIEKPEIFSGPAPRPSYGVLLYVLLGLSGLFSLLSFALLFAAYQPV